MKSLIALLCLTATLPAFAQSPEPGREPGGGPPPPNLAFELDAPGAVRTEVQVHADGFEPLTYDFTGTSFEGVYAPPGSATIYVEAFDSRGEPIYRGKVSAEIDGKLTREFTVPLDGGRSKQRVEARFGSYLLDVVQSRFEKNTLLEVTLYNPLGKPVHFEPDDLAWQLPEGFPLLKYSCFRESLCIELPDLREKINFCLEPFSCTTPEPAPPGPYVFVAVGDNHTCAITRNSTVRCWGDNSEGQLGVPTGDCLPNRKCSTTPVQVVCPSSSTCLFRSLTAADNHTCAVDTLNKVWCWGSKGNQATGGGGSHLSRDDPWHWNVPASIFPGGAVAFTSISTSTGHTCAVTTAQDVFCWGSNSHGQIALPGSIGVGTNIPNRILSGNRYQSVSVGDQHSCAVHVGGQNMDCWGDNGSFQLTGNSNSALFITIGSKVQWITGKTVDLIAAGPASTCVQANHMGLASTSNIVCWGSASLGTGPTLETGGWFALPNAFADSVAADSVATNHPGCGGTVCTRICAAGGGPDLMCGFWRVFGASQLTAVALPKNEPFANYVQVDVGPNHVCSITGQNDVHCFGVNAFGQFGTGVISTLETDSPETATQR